MRVFTDSLGREWTLNLTVASMRRVKDLAGIDLAEVVEKDKTLLSDLYMKPAVISAVLLALVHTQMVATGVTKGEFEAALSGPALHAGKQALLDEITDFFSSFLPGEGALIARWRTLMDGLATSMMRQSAEKMGELAGAATPPPPSEPPQPPQGSGTPSGDAQESAASTPAP